MGYYSFLFLFAMLFKFLKSEHILLMLENKLILNILKIELTKNICLNLEELFE